MTAYQSTKPLLVGQKADYGPRMPAGLNAGGGSSEAMYARMSPRAQAVANAAALRRNQAMTAYNAQVAAANLAKAQQQQQQGFHSMAPTIPHLAGYSVAPANTPSSIVFNPSPGHR